MFVKGQDGTIYNLNTCLCISIVDSQVHLHLPTDDFSFSIADYDTPEQAKTMIEKLSYVIYSEEQASFCISCEGRYGMRYL